MKTKGKLMLIDSETMADFRYCYCRRCRFFKHLYRAAVGVGAVLTMLLFFGALILLAVVLQ